MPEKPSSRKDNENISPRFLFIGLTFVLVGILQLLMFWKLEATENFICNGGGAWPLPEATFLGSSLFTLVIAAGLLVWAWKSLRDLHHTIKNYVIALFWALIVSAGASHFLERVTSECVLDYWQLPFFKESIYFNGGDIFLFVGATGLILCWGHAAFSKD